MIVGEPVGGAPGEQAGTGWGKVGQADGGIGVEECNGIATDVGGGSTYSYCLPIGQAYRSAGSACRQTIVCSSCACFALLPISA